MKAPKRLSQRIREDRITMRIAQRGDVPAGEDERLEWYDVRLRIPHDDDIALSGRTMNTDPFGIHPRRQDPLSLEDVVSSVVLIARHVYLNMSREGEDASFRAWADEWSFDPDDEQRREMWERQRHLMYRLKSFLGTRKFKAYMTDTEDDI